MESRIAERFGVQILKDAANRYGVSSERLEKLGGFESFIFKFQQNSKGYILRIAHSLRRTEKLIKAEVEWIRYLASKGVSVADAVLSDNGNLVESIPDGHGGSFLATAFKEVAGKPPYVIGWSPDLFHEYGSLIGRMHRLTKEFTPLDSLVQRPLWNSSEMNADVLVNLPADKPEAKQRYQEIVSHLNTLPSGIDDFGLIHFDAHSGNMLIEESGKINLFDFDDCNRNWFVNDLAIVLFYMVTNAREPEKLAGDFLPPFLEGYATENTLDSKWLSEIPVFLRMREIDLYAVIRRSFDLDALDGWCKMFMEGREQRIMNAIPFLDIDFSLFEKYLK